MANEQNLKPYRKGDLSSEEAKRRGRLGGQAKAKARRERKAMQELAKIVLDMPMEDGDLDDIEDMNFSQLRVKKLTLGEKGVLMAGRKASKGDLAALTFLRDTAGEKPVERVEVNADLEEARAEIAGIVQKVKQKHEQCQQD